MNLTIEFRPCGENKGAEVGYVLVKNPAKVRTSTEIPGCVGHVWFSEATDKIAAMEMVGICDPERGEDAISTTRFTTGSIFCRLLSKMFRSALRGDCKDRPDLVASLWSVELSVGPMEGRGLCADDIASLWRQLGYEARVKAWSGCGTGQDFIFTADVSHPGVTVQALLSQLILLLQAIDPRRDGPINDDQERQLRLLGLDWLDRHPQRQWITRRLFGERRGAEDASTETSLAQVSQVEGAAVEEVIEAESVPLAELRRRRIVELIREEGLGGFVLEVGCGSGRLLEALSSAGVESLGLDASVQAVRTARRFIRKLPNANAVVGFAGFELPPVSRDSDGKLRFGSYGSEGELPGVIVASEVVEHIHPHRLDHWAASIFFGRPVILTTPNRDYNQVWGLTGLRHWDHKFEWSVDEFVDWGRGVSSRFGYDVKFFEVGPVVDGVGAPTQGAVFVPRMGADHRPIALEPSPYTIRSVLVPLLAKEIQVSSDQRESAMNSLSHPKSMGLEIPWIPATTGAVDAAAEGDLEQIEDATRYYRERGLPEVIIEEKHMGSRCVIRLNREGVDPGFAYTRMGWRFFGARDQELAILHALRAAVTKADLWSCFGDWVLLDGEMLPWSLKWGDLAFIYDGLAATVGANQRWLARWRGQLGIGMHPDLPALVNIAERVHVRTSNLYNFREELRKYVSSRNTVRYAPFGILASSQKVWSDVPHENQLKLIDRIVDGDVLQLTKKTRRMVVSTDVKFEDETTEKMLPWFVWGEGVVVKPLSPLTRSPGGDLLQPALKVRTSPYLRLVYGPEYKLIEDRLRERSTRRKRALALQGAAIGHEALLAYVEGGGVPTPRVQRLVFAALGIELTPMDSRL